MVGVRGRGRVSGRVRLSLPLPQESKRFQNIDKNWEKVMP